MLGCNPESLWRFVFAKEFLDFFFHGSCILWMWIILAHFSLVFKCKKNIWYVEWKLTIFLFILHYFYGFPLLWMFWLFRCLLLLLLLFLFLLLLLYNCLHSTLLRYSQPNKWTIKLPNNKNAKKVSSICKNEIILLILSPNLYANYNLIVLFFWQKWKMYYW